jgi:hypothetical protein
MNQLNVSLQYSITTLAANGWSHWRIMRELDIHRETVGLHLRLAKASFDPLGDTIMLHAIAEQNFRTTTYMKLLIDMFPMSVIVFTLTDNFSAISLYQ